MIRCKECKYWDKKGQPWHDDIYARCGAINEGVITKEDSVIAYVSDCMDGASHSFHTREDFGCVIGKKYT